MHQIEKQVFSLVEIKANNFYPNTPQLSSKGIQEKGTKKCGHGTQGDKGNIVSKFGLPRKFGAYLCTIKFLNLFQVYMRHNSQVGSGFPTIYAYQISWLIIYSIRNIFNL